MRRLTCHLSVFISFFLATHIMFGQPSNDLCVGATLLVADGTCMLIDNGGSSPSNHPSPTLSCGFMPSSASDMWYKVVVPPSGNLVIETEQPSGGLSNTDIEGYIGSSCGDLIPIACNSVKERYNSYDDHSIIELENQIAGDTVWIRVVSSSSGVYRICAKDDSPVFPCRIELVTLGVQGACDPQTNTFSQEVTVHYRTDASTQGLNINSQFFSLTGSPQIVTLTGLVANSSNVNLFTSLSGTSSACSKNSIFERFDFIQAPSNCYSGTVANDSCHMAIPLPVNKQCIGQVFDLTGATQSTEDGFCSTINQDVWFSFEAPTSGDVLISTYSTGDVTPYVVVYEGDCSSRNFLSCGYHLPTRISDRTPGETLYIKIYDLQNDDQGEFGICILELESHTNDICIDAVELDVGTTCGELNYSTHLASVENNPTTTSSCDNSNNPTYDIWFKATMPASGSMTIFTESVVDRFFNIVLEALEGDCSGLTFVGCEASNINNGNALINLSGDPGNQYFFRVSGWGNNTAVFRLCAKVVENDDCQDAISLSTDGSCLLSSNLGATSSNNPLNRFICSDSVTVQDLWFSVIVPASGHISVETKMVTEGIYDMVLEAYEGDCSSLTYIQCNDSKVLFENSDPHALIDLEGRNPGEEINIRVGSKYSSDLGEFEICASDMGYTNSCKITLIELGDQSNCNPASNSFDQELIVYFRDDGSSNTLRINNQYYPLETSPQSIWLTDLASAGQGVNIDAELLGNSFECTVNSHYFANSFIQAPENCFSGIVVNDVCTDAISLDVGNDCMGGIYDLTGSNASSGPFNCSSLSQDLWFSFIVPASGNVVISTYRLSSSNVFAEFEVLSGTCGSFDLIDCGSVSNSRRLSDRIPGELIYVKVSDSQRGQGEFGICILEVENLTNDICSNAIDLEFTEGCNELLYSTHSAFSEGFPTDRLSCDESNGMSVDIWFKTQVPVNGNLTVYAENVENNGLELAIEIYEGNCQGLISLGCDFSFDVNGRAVVSINNAVQGTSLFIRIAPRNFFSSSAFRICSAIIENDFCEDSKLFPIVDVCDPDTIDLSIHSPSLIPTPLPLCVGSSASSFVDAWYKIIVADEDDFVIRTVSLEDNVYSAAIIELYYNDCSDLQQFECQGFNEPMSNASIRVVNQSIGETIYVRVMTASGNVSSFGLCAVKVPVNDICEGAIDLDLNNCYTYNMQDALASNTPSFGLSCGDIGQQGKDMWFSATVPSSGNLRIETNEITNGIENLDMEVYIGGCEALVPIACNTSKDQFTEVSNHALIELENLNPSEIVYIRVVTNNVVNGNFELCISDEPVSNRCAITLITPIGNGVCRFDSISFSQELLVHYYTDGSATDLIVNNQVFQLTGSPQLITLEGLPSYRFSGYKIDVHAELISPRNECRVNSSYFSLDLIEGVPCRPINDDCMNPIHLTTGQTCLEEIFELTGSTDGGNYINNPFSCFTVGQYPNDVWFTFEVPTNGEAVINAFVVDIDVTFEIYSGSCNSGFSLVESCGAPWSSIRVTDRTPGEILYIRVADINNDEEGMFGLCILEVEEFVNDICIDAIELPLSSTCTSNNYSGHLALAEELPFPTLSCDLSGVSSKDMWFRIPVTESSDITIFTREIERGYSDLELEIYTGDCSSLVSIYCDIGSGDNGHGLVSLLGLPVQDLFVRVAGYGGVFNDAFQICAIPDCRNNINIDAPIDGHFVYVASETINSTSRIISESNVKFDAALQVQLFSNFEIESGALFEVGLVGCQE